MRAIIFYIILNAVRNKLYIGLILFLLTAISLSIFLGSTAFIEEQQFTNAYIAGLSRIIIESGMIIFVCINIGKAFENKEIEFIISKSISREKFILSSIAGFLLSAILIIIPLILLILIICKVNYLGLFIWSTTIITETTIAISFALLSSLILKNSFSAIMASFGFYILSHLIGIFVMSIKIIDKVSDIKGQDTISLLKIMLKFISAILPRLDLFAQTKWLNYGITDFTVLPIIALQALIYIPLMIAMACHDFKKKQF